MAAKPGPVSQFNDALQEQMIALFEEGKTEEQVADIIGVSSRTIRAWKGKHKTFLPALRKAKQVADNLVEAALFSRAVGYSHPEEKIFCSKDGDIVRADTVRQYPPDTAAAIIWLKNRQPEKWREKMPGEDQINITISLADRMAKARARGRK